MTQWVHGPLWQKQAVVSYLEIVVTRREIMFGCFVFAKLGCFVTRTKLMFMYVLLTIWVWW